MASSLIEKIQEDYFRTCGLNCFFLSNENMNSGSTCIGCNYCRHIQDTQDGLYKCYRQRHLALREAIANGQGKVFRCHAGLVEWIVPVIDKDEVMGSLCSGFVIEPRALDNLYKQKGYFQKRYEMSEALLMESLQSIRVIEDEQIEILFKMLVLMVRYHFRSTRDQRYHAALELRLPLPEDYYESLGSNNLKLVGQTTYRELYAKCYQEKGARGIRKLREQISAYEDEFCRCIAENRTLEAKNLFIMLVSPAYKEPDPGWRIYQTNSRISRLTKRLYDYFGYNEQLNKAKYEIFWHLIHTREEKEVRLVTQDYYQLILNVFTFKPPERSIAVYEKAKDFINTHSAQNIKVTDVAAALKISPDYLGRVFRARQGMPIKKYLSLARVNHVKEYLLNTDWSIEAIAESLDFGSVRSLHRLFKELVGVTCGEYRALYRHQAYELEPDRSDPNQIINPSKG